MLESSPARSPKLWRIWPACMDHSLDGQSFEGSGLPAWILAWMIKALKDLVCLHGSKLWGSNAIRLSLLIPWYSSTLLLHILAYFTCQRVTTSCWCSIYVVTESMRYHVTFCRFPRELWEMDKEEQRYSYGMSSIVLTRWIDFLLSQTK